MKLALCWCCLLKAGSYCKNVSGGLNGIPAARISPVGVAGGGSRGGGGDADFPALYFVGTQVEFPEARIYEETLNILLYEAQDGRGPDNALLEATGGAAGRSHHLEEDEERERIERVRRIHIKRPDDRAHLHQ